jgi:hypothetical protein
MKLVIVLTFIAFAAGIDAKKNPAPKLQSLHFTKVQVASENFESAAAIDVNGDAIADIVSGSFWYKGPDFKNKYFIGDQKRYGEYYDDFSTIPLDVNEDGRIDFITGGWWGNTIRWRENPGNEGEWKEHVIANTGNVETTIAWDINGDGALEIVPNTPGKALVAYRKEKGGSTFISHKIAESHGHGLGFGDINNDGRGDFIISSGWLEAPADPFARTWIMHQDFVLGTASVPIIVADVNKDGLADIIVGQGHDYGLHWYEQKLDKKERKWIKHVIDSSGSQYHTMAWVDIDNDGKEELVTGKRYRAHNEKDPGSFDPIGLYYYQWSGKSFSRNEISYGVFGEGKGTGIYFWVEDLDGNKWKDIIVAGKDGLFVFYNKGRY